MEYYKILLVDDELEIRDGMIQKLDWHQLGYDVAAAAENGVEALEKADQVQPDVIMTDIRMPFMDLMILNMHRKQSIWGWKNTY